MSQWIAHNVPKEQRRREVVEAFVKAGEQFISELYAQISADLEEYRRHFPGERLEVKHDRLTLEVFRWSDVSFALTVKVHIDPIEESVIYEIPSSENLSKATPASIEQDSIVLDGTRAVSNATLHEFMLMPILFPGLVNDTGVHRFLKQQFSPR